MDCQVQIIQHVDEVGQQSWDQLGDGRPFASYRWYRFGETVLTDDVSEYLLVSHHGMPVARATLWLTRQEPLPISSRPVRMVVQMLLRQWPLLVCRAPLSSASGLVLPADPSQRDAVLLTITQTIQERMQKHRAAVGLVDYLEQPEANWPGWPRDFVPTVVSDPGTRLEIVWPDFDSYVRQLAKSVQKDYRRHRNRAAELGIVVTADHTPPPAPTALRLIREVERRHHSAPIPWNAAILSHADMIDGVWLKATIGDRLVGCGLLAGDGGIRFLSMLGLDYEVQYVYFQLFYAAIRRAIETGAQVLRGGSGAYETKQRLGFQLESNNYVTYTTNHRLLRWLARRLS
jgi:predicted N-acyltransferase